MNQGEHKNSNNLLQGLYIPHFSGQIAVVNNDPCLMQRTHNVAVKIVRLPNVFKGLWLCAVSPIREFDNLHQSENARENYRKNKL